MLLRSLRLRRRMNAGLGYRPNLRHPRTFNEKLGWRILHDRNPLFPLTIDKAGVRDWVAERVGSDILIPLYGVWNSADDIVWDDLPSMFALKATHGWNMNLLIKEKTRTNRKACLVRAAEWLKRSHYDATGEWGYRDVPKRVLAEQLIGGRFSFGPTEFKLHVFGGKFLMLRVHKNRHHDHRVNYYDSGLNRINVTQGSLPIEEEVLPYNINDYVLIAEKLGAEFDYVRVDLYQDGDKIRFSELTHYDSGATRPFIPAEFDRTLGDMWRLPNNR